MPVQRADPAVDPQVREAAHRGDFGRVLQLARTALGMTQRQLAASCGLSQSALSRIESRGPRDYPMATMATAARHLGLPLHLVGLAESAPNGPHAVERRTFLTGVLAASLPNARFAPTSWDGSQTDALRAATSAYRCLDATVCSRDLAEPVHAHLRLIQLTANRAPDRAHRSRLAAAGSEAAGLSGWLAWDMADHGSARTWYGAAVKAARSAGDALLSAYQTGTLAQFEADTGSPHEALRLVHRARRALGPEAPAVASAWLFATEALAHAGLGDARSADQSLAACEQHAARVPDAEPAPWPWLFTFDERKVAATRISCAARLRRPVPAGLTVLPSKHAKQHALLTLDLAAIQLAAGRPDTAFSLASEAVDEGLRLRSGRILDKARALRRSHHVKAATAAVRAFDERLHDTHM